jgi:TnpA family transposase
MLHTVHYPRDIMVDRVIFTPADHDRIALCRGLHNRLGFAYQMGFMRLTGRLPSQRPLEILDELLAFVAHEVALETTLIHDYAQRQATVSAHQEHIRLYLGFRSFGRAEQDELRRYVLSEASRLEHLSALRAQAEAFLYHQRILIPSPSTLRRFVIEQRERARQLVYTQMIALLSTGLPARLDELLENPSDQSYSPLQALKAPPGVPSPRALLRLTEKLDRIEQTEVLGLELSWLNPNLQKTLAQHAWQSSAYRLRQRLAPQRYTILVCFLRDAYHDTIDQLVEMYNKLVTGTYRRAQHELDDTVKRRRVPYHTALESFYLMGQTLFDESIPPEAIRTTVFDHIPPERLKNQLQQAHQWLSQDSHHVFSWVMKRYSYWRQFAPDLLDHLTFNLEPTGSPALLEAVEVLRELNATGRRKLPEDLSLDAVPKRLRPFIGSNGVQDRRAYECAVLTTLRDEIQQGNVWVSGSKRFGQLDEFFLPQPEWEAKRDDFFRHAGLPSDPSQAATYLQNRLASAYDRFLNSLPANAYVTVEDQGWRLSTDPAEELSPEEEAGVASMRSWLRDKVDTIRLPDLLIAVDNLVDWSRHFISPSRREMRSADDVCQVVATIMAYGCNIGPETMARLTNGVSYADIERITDWHLHGDSLRAALAEIVNAIVALDTTRVWGDGSSTSSDGQRFLFPRRVLRRTYSHRLGDFGLEFYTFISDNYAPFYSVPIECTERDAPYVLDGLLYHESDLDPQEHYTDTHGYIELNFAAFPMFGKRFCPRIRGLHRQWIYCLDRQKDYGPLNPIVKSPKHTLHLDWITSHWDRIGQFFASFAAGQSTASVALKRLLACGPRNHFYRAVRELGRLYKSIFILDYLSDPQLRRRIRQGLLKSEQLHALARQVHYGKRGQTDGRDFQQQMSRASCLVLIEAAIIYWQILQIDEVLRFWDLESEGIDPSWLAHMSPIRWDNVVLYGEYAMDRNLVRQRRHFREHIVEN